MSSPQEAIKQYEDAALLAAGLTIPFGCTLLILTGLLSTDSVVPVVLVVAWLVWFGKWAVEGGIPPRGF